MFYEMAQSVLYFATAAVAVLTVIMAGLLFFRLLKKDYDMKIKKNMLWVFGFLALGYTINSIAEILWDILYETSGAMPDTGISDIFWIAGALVLFGTFLYFSLYMYKEHGQIKKGVTLISVIGILSAIMIYYLITHYIMGAQGGETSFQIFTDYFYPISSAMILIVSLSVYLFFRKLENLGTPMLYLALVSVFNFIGDMLYTYYSWNDIYGIYGVISDSTYVIAYILSAIAFYSLFERMASPDKE